MARHVCVGWYVCLIKISALIRSLSKISASRNLGYTRVHNRLEYHRNLVPRSSISSEGQTGGSCGSGSVYSPHDRTVLFARRYSVEIDSKCASEVSVHTRLQEINGCELCAKVPTVRLPAKTWIGSPSGLMQKDNKHDFGKLYTLTLPPKKKN